MGMVNSKPSLPESTMRGAPSHPTQPLNLCPARRPRGGLAANHPLLESCPMTSQMARPFRPPAAGDMGQGEGPAPSPCTPTPGKAGVPDNHNQPIQPQSPWE